MGGRGRAADKAPARAAPGSQREPRSALVTLTPSSLAPDPLMVAVNRATLLFLVALEFIYYYSIYYR
jgi:hypothetical protein